MARPPVRLAARAAGKLAGPLVAVVVSLILFSVLLAIEGQNPILACALMWRGAFGTWFSWQTTLVAASPLLLTGLCVAIPAQLGLLIIGGEGAFVLGGLAAVAAGLPLASIGLPPFLIQTAMALAGMTAGAALIGFCGLIRIRRGVNEVISSLLLAYIAIAVMNQIVEGPMRDPASLNRPATRALPDAIMLPMLGHSSVHVGLLLGIAACLIAYVVMAHTRFGFAARIVGGNLRAGRLAGLPVERLILTACCAAGAAAGLGGMVEVAAVQGVASADLVTSAGPTGILVAFLARQNALALIPVAILLGGLDAAGNLLQQRLGVPDATMLVLRGILFVMLLVSDAMIVALRGAWQRRPRAAAARVATVALGDA